MKILHILIALGTASTITYSAQQPQAPAHQVAHSVIHRPITQESERFCKCCCVTLIACCLYSAFLMSDESRVYGQLESLKTTQDGKKAIAELTQNAYRKGLIAGQIQCPKHSPQEMLRDGAYQPCLCWDLSIQRVLKKNN